MAPTMAEATVGLRSTYAMSTCAMGRPRASATSLMASMMGSSAGESKVLATAWISARRVWAPQGRVNRGSPVMVYAYHGGTAGSA